MRGRRPLAALAVGTLIGVVLAQEVSAGHLQMSWYLEIGRSVQRDTLHTTCASISSGAVLLTVPRLSAPIQAPLRTPRSTLAAENDTYLQGALFSLRVP